MTHFQASPEIVPGHPIAEGLHAYALAAHAAGLCVVPPKQDGSKMPVGKPYEDTDGGERYGWTPWQSERSTPDELADWYARQKKTGIGYVCGAVSGGLEMFEFEHREKRDAFMAVAEQLGMVDLVARIRTGYESDTPGGGVHWLYRCDEVTGNTKLACRPKRPDEKKHPKDDVQVLIETRGEGGYTVEAPSNGKVHPTGGMYRLVSGGVETIATVTPDERRQLHDLAETFDEMPENAPKAATEPIPREPEDDGGLQLGPAWNALRVDVIKDFNARATWESVLGPHGWQVAHPSGDMAYWRRPGKDRDHSATTNYGGSDRFCVFSSSTEFKVTTKEGSKAGYDKFGAYAVLNHGGDQKAAYRDLSDQAYGREWTPPADWTKELSDDEITHRARERREQAAGAPTKNGTAHQKAPASAQRRPLTDLGNAERLLGDFMDDLHYCHPWSTWLTWETSRWRRDMTGRVRRYARHSIRFMYAEAAEVEDKAERLAIAAHAKRSESAAACGAMLKWAESLGSVPILPEEMDAGPWLFNVSNGTLDLRTGELRPHDQTDKITKLAPIAYDRAAECPTFLAFLARVVPDEHVRGFLQRAVGYCLTADTSAQCLFFLHGGGANGKSTFLDVVLALLGEYGKQAAPDLLTHKSGDRHPTELADLFGARLITSVEVDEGKRLAETLVKQMTGGDRMKARFMRGDFFEWAPTHKLLLAANHRPVIRGTDYAIWRRIHLIPFTVTIPEDERDGHLPEKLHAELPGILNWAIAGCLDWQRNGLGVPQAVKDATADYRAEQDLLGDFLAERCVRDPQATVSAKSLWDAWKEWCEASSEREGTQRGLGLRLAERGFEQARGAKGVRMWRRVRLLSPDEVPTGDAYGSGDAERRGFSYSSSDSPREEDMSNPASQASPEAQASPADFTEEDF